jgi:hypothetical protein
MDRMVAAIVFAIMVILYLALVARTLFLHFTGRLKRGEQRDVKDVTSSHPDGS